MRVIHFKSRIIPFLIARPFVLGAGFNLPAQQVLIARSSSAGKAERVSVGGGKWSIGMSFGRSRRAINACGEADYLSLIAIFEHQAHEPSQPFAGRGASSPAV